MKNIFKDLLKRLNERRERKRRVLEKALGKFGNLPEDRAVRNRLRKEKKKTEKKKSDMSGFIVENNKAIRNVVLVIVVLSGLMFPFVRVNYDLVKYLPETVDSKKAIDRMEDIFGYPGTGRLELMDVTIYEAENYKKRIEKVNGVSQVLWADLTENIYSSSEFIDPEEIKDYYRDGNVVMDITFKEGDTSELTKEAINDIENIVDGRGFLVGSAPTQKFVEESVQKEMKLITVFAVAMVFLILILTTASWFEPVLFLSVIGCAVVINKGTNIFLGEISYVTNNISDMLQLATSMDYSVFLLHSFEREREKGKDKKEALKDGLSSTITTILSASLTTFVGFIVLVFMRYSIGFDMGIVMAKGIICSLLMIIFMMPSLLLGWSDIIDRTRHKPFMPKFHRFSELVNRLSPIIVAVSLLLAIPAYIGQSLNNFQYGTDATGAGPGTSMYENTARINEEFGRSNLIVAIFRDGDYLSEKALSEEISEKDYVKKLMSLSEYLPEGVPEIILPASVRELFHKDGYARMLIYIKTKPESDAAFKYTEEISDIIKSYYEDAYITGNTPVTMDMASIIAPDYTFVNSLAMIGIFIIVALSFRTPVLPIATMIPILMATYVNMCVPYLQGQPMIFMSYLVVSCIQLGATIDYAISCTENYIQIREEEPDRNKASQMMVERSFPSILTSGAILIVCGYAISYMSSIPAISRVGQLVGRGAILSIFFVVGMMPILLRLADRYITTTFAQRHAKRRAAVQRAFIRTQNIRRDRFEYIDRLMKGSDEENENPEEEVKEKEEKIILEKQQENKSLKEKAIKTEAEDLSERREGEE